MECVQLLVKRGAFVNPTELHPSRNTPLDFALLSHHADVADYLRGVGGLPCADVKVVARVWGGVFLLVFF
jgi:hypothetical protein